MRSQVSKMISIKIATEKWPTPLASASICFSLTALCVERINDVD